MLNVYPSQLHPCIVGEKVAFPLNNLESVLVRDFLLQSLICIIPALSNPCQPTDLFYFYFILAEQCTSADSHPLTVHLGTSHASRGIVFDMCCVLVAGFCGRV